MFFVKENIAWNYPLELSLVKSCFHTWGKGITCFSNKFDKFLIGMYYRWKNKGKIIFKELIRIWNFSKGYFKNFYSYKIFSIKSGFDRFSVKKIEKVYLETLFSSVLTRSFRTIQEIDECEIKQRVGTRRDQSFE